MAFGFKQGRGFPVHVSRKQKLNASGSRTCKLVGADDVLPKNLWTPLFLKGQGHETTSDEVHQDVMSAVLSEENGRKSAGERTQALNIWCFVITDHASKGNLEIHHCSMDEMMIDYHTEPLQGKKFQEFCDEIMGFA